MLADSGATLLLGDRAAAGRAAEDHAGPAVWLDDPATLDELSRQSDRSPAFGKAMGDTAACVIYTSGSTGRPKGTLVTHRSLTGVYAAWADAHFDHTGYRWLSLTNISFDVFTGDLVRALASGGCLVLGAVGLQLSTPEWARYLAEARINALECAPRYADELVGHLERTGGSPADLRLLVVTTDVWRTAAAAAARRVLGPDVRVLTAYGVTEATIDSTYGVMAATTDQDRPAPIGGPLPNTRVHVLDRTLTPVPVGVAGEVFIGGVGVARGYVDRPDLTAERFVADPNACDGTRLYRTGDRAFWRPDGQLEFLGRADDQVKVRGFRIEPGEVEAALRRHRGVADAVVAAVDDRLVAYLVPADHAAGVPAPSELRELLGGSLPEYMIPAVFVELAALPLTPNGKIDRAALPAPGGDRPGLAGGYVAPRTATEDVLAGIWSEVLGVDRRSVRRLLRAWRAFAAGHAGHVPGAGRLCGGGAAGGSVRPADGGRPGRGDRRC